MIAEFIGRASSTVYDEVKVSGGREGYSPSAAQARADELRAREKPLKLVSSERLHDRVNEDLAGRWSPQQISARLTKEFPEDSSMQVCAETIYQTLYLQARGELRTSVKLMLRTGRTRRRE